MKMKYTILRKPFAWQYLMPNMIEDFNIEIEQANKLNTVCNMSAFNSTGLQELKKIADKYHQISNDFKIVEKDGKLNNTAIMKIKLRMKRRMIRIHSRKIVYLNQLK